MLLKDKQMMFKKTIIALCGVAAVGLLTPTSASARPAGHGSGGARVAMHGGGGGGAYRGGGYRGGAYHGGGGFGGGFGGAAIAAGAVGLGLGLAAAPYDGYGGYGGYGDPSGYDSYAYGDGGCYLVRQRVMTPYGWRVRPVQVCN